MMKKNNLDLLLLTVLENVRYVTDVKPVFGVDYAVDGYAAVVPVEGRPTLIRPYAGENPLRLPEVSTSKYVYVPVSGTLVSKEWASLFAGVLRSNFSSGLPVRIGVDHLSFETYSDLQSQVKGTYIPIMREMLEARAVKLPEEIKLMREAARVLDVGMEAAARELKPGASEFTVGGAILDAMAKEGIEQVPFWPVVVSGKTPPGAESSGVFTGDKKIDRDDVVIIDFGCHVKSGYSGDYGRVFFLGGKQSKAKELYEVLYDVIMNGIRKAKPGIYASELDDACRQIIKQRGYEDPEPEIGHGLGLKVAELPRITRPAEAKSTGTDMKLETGMVVNLEPIVHVPKTMWMWVENTMLITENGSEVLTKFPFEPS
jgi:Xaa-Pro dipeptidase